ncbi:hypothetical protein D3C80_1529410 [compost metagenome]
MHGAPSISAWINSSRVGSPMCWKSSIIRYSSDGQRARLLISSDGRIFRLSPNSAALSSVSSSGNPACCRAPIRFAQNCSGAPSSCASDSQTTVAPCSMSSRLHCASRMVLPKPALPVSKTRRP